MSTEDWQALFSSSHIKTHSPACCLSPLLVALFSSLFFSAFLVVYAWQVVADVARNDADGTHNHTEWK